MSEISENFGFYYNHNLIGNSLDCTKKYAADLSLKYETNLNSSDFVAKLQDFKSPVFFVLSDLRTISPLDLL